MYAAKPLMTGAYTALINPPVCGATDPTTMVPVMGAVTSRWHAVVSTCHGRRAPPLDPSVEPSGEPCDEPAVGSGPNSVPTGVDGPMERSRVVGVAALPLVHATVAKPHVTSKKTARERWWIRERADVVPRSIAPQTVPGHTPSDPRVIRDALLRN